MLRMGSAIGTLKKGVKYVNVNNKDTRTTPGVVPLSLLLTLNIFGHVINGWEFTPELA